MGMRLRPAAILVITRKQKGLGGLVKDVLFQSARVWLWLTLSPFMAVYKVLQFYGVLFSDKQSSDSTPISEILGIQLSALP